MEKRKNEKGKDGVKYCENPGVCFETQFYPDAINIKEFPSPVVKAGYVMKTQTKFEYDFMEDL